VQLALFTALDIVLFANKQKDSQIALPVGLLMLATKNSAQKTRKEVLININKSDNEITISKINKHDIPCTFCILGEHFPTNHIYECTSNFSTRICRHQQATLQRCE
jgi:hypothetical protein